MLKLTFGNVRFLFGADLNEESEDRLLTHANAEGFSLAAEILKVPHHGSADFSPQIEAIKPVVSVVSSGDENSAKEYIHRRRCQGRPADHQRVSQDGVRNRARADR